MFTDDHLNAIRGSAVFVVKQLNTVGWACTCRLEPDFTDAQLNAVPGSVMSLKPEFTDTQLQSVLEYPSPPSTTRRSSLQRSCRDVSGPR